MVAESIHLPLEAAEAHIAAKFYSWSAGVKSNVLSSCFAQVLRGLPFVIWRSIVLTQRDCII